MRSADDLTAAARIRDAAIEQFADYIKRETAAWAKIIQETGLTIQ